MNDKVALELLAIELYKFDKGTNRQWAGIDVGERITYREQATKLLSEPTEVVVEPHAGVLTIPTFDAPKKRGRPPATGPKIIHSGD